MAVLVPCLARLRAGFDRLNAARDRASDGWIGDLAHQAEPSGHNPDESGNAEESDHDGVDEVRAIDVDADLKLPGITMRQCVDLILATPADRSRLMYVIFDGNIYGSWSGFRGERYWGPDPHTSHAHFSSEMGADGDNRPWSIERLIPQPPKRKAFNMAVVYDVGGSYFLQLPDALMWLDASEPVNERAFKGTPPTIVPLDTKNWEALKTKYGAPIGGV